MEVVLSHYNDLAYFYLWAQNFCCIEKYFKPKQLINHGKQ